MPVDFIIQEDYVNAKKIYRGADKIFTVSKCKNGFC